MLRINIYHGQILAFIIIYPYLLKYDLVVEAVSIFSAFMTWLKKAKIKRSDQISLDV